MATKFYTLTLAEFMRDKIKTNLQVELGLVTVMVGDLSRIFWPASEDAASYASAVPAVCITPTSISNGLQTLNQRYEQTNLFRVVYVDRIAEGTTHIANLLRILRVADQVLEDYRLDTISGLSQGQVVLAEVLSIEFDPPENSVLESADAQLFAAAFVLAVKLLVWNL